MTQPRFAPPIAMPVLPDERYHVAPQVNATRAEKLIHEIIEGGAFRPPDAARMAKIEEVYALFVPFWRIDLQRNDDALSLSQVQVGKIGIPIPRQRSTNARATWMICARTVFPYKMKHPSTLLPGDAKPLTLSLAAITPGDPDPGTTEAWEVLDADVSERQARALGGASLAKSGSGDHDIFTSSELTAHASHFVRYPIWFARYRYQGVATPEGDLFYVGISAASGLPVTAQHPSKLRAGAARIKGFFGSFGLGKTTAEDAPPREEAATSETSAKAETSETSAKAAAPREAATKPADAPSGVDLEALFRAHVKREKDKR